MDPNFDKMTGFNLPQPVEGESQQSAHGEALPANPEQVAVNGAEVARPLGVPALSTPVSPVPVVPTTIPPTDVTVAVPLVTSPPTADDQDLIEKEWVHKAKQIVEKTRDDPYTQTKELTKFKADYMQKRYNKSVKLSE